MSPNERADVPREYADVHDTAVALMSEPSVIDAFRRVLTDDRLAGKLAEQPDALADILGVKVPEGLTLQPLGVGKPGPDWLPFTIRLTACRKYYRIKDGKLEEAEVCRGIEIVPNQISPIG